MQPATATTPQAAAATRKARRPRPRAPGYRTELPRRRPRQRVTTPWMTKPDVRRGALDAPVPWRVKLIPEVCVDMVFDPVFMTIFLRAQSEVPRYRDDAGSFGSAWCARRHPVCAHRDTRRLARCTTRVRAAFPGAVDDDRQPGHRRLDNRAEQDCRQADCAAVAAHGV